MKEEKQQKMMELQVLNQQAGQLKQQLDQLMEQMEGLENLRESLKEVEKEKDGKEMYTPISSGIFLNSELKDNKKVLISVGAGVVVKKDIKEAQKMLEEQSKKMALVIKQVQSEFEKYAVSAMNLEKELSESQ